MMGQYQNVGMSERTATYAKNGNQGIATPSEISSNVCQSKGGRLLPHPTDTRIQLTPMRSQQPGIQQVNKPMNTGRQGVEKPYQTPVNRYPGPNLPPKFIPKQVLAQFAVKNAQKRLAGTLKNDQVPESHTSSIPKEEIVRLLRDPRGATGSAYKTDNDSAFPIQTQLKKHTVVNDIKFTGIPSPTLTPNECLLYNLEKCDYPFSAVQIKAAECLQSLDKNTKFKISAVLSFNSFYIVPVLSGSSEFMQLLDEITDCCSLG